MKKQIVLQRGLILGLISMMVILMSGCFAGAITDEPYLGEEVSELSLIHISNSGRDGKKGAAIADPRCGGNPGGESIG